jgi:hypothetical protein
MSPLVSRRTGAASVEAMRSARAEIRENCMLDKLNVVG